MSIEEKRELGDEYTEYDCCPSNEMTNMVVLTLAMII